MSRAKNFLPRAVFSLASLFFISILILQPLKASALSQEDIRSILSGTAYYDSSASCDTSSVKVPAGTLPAFIPEPYNGAFTQGANAHNVAPGLVASLFSEENALGGDTHNPSTTNLPSAWANFIKRHPDPNGSWNSSTAGAQGPFQFLGSTWTGLGYDLGDINNLVTAADAAAKYVASNGAIKDKPEAQWHDAIFNYNHAEWYVNAVLKYYDYYNSQPGAEGSGGSSNVTLVNSDCTSVCSQSASTNFGTSNKTIVIDPGHAGNNTVQVDPSSGIETQENSGAPDEMQSMWDAAQQIKSKLMDAGYNVVLTKNSENDTAGFVTKVGRANAANPVLAVSLHYTGDAKFGVPNDHYGVTPQEVGRFRENKDNGKRLTFSDSALAEQSRKYSQIMAQERTKVGDDTKVAPLDQSFPKNRGDVLAWGDTPIVELLAKVPWVYNETGSIGFNEQKYAEGVTNGIMRAVPLNGNDDSASSCSAGVVAGNIAQTAIGLSWPESHGTAPRDSYVAAMRQYNEAGYAATNHLGTDCGVFVATVMHASGADPNYPDSYTVAQANYVIGHPEKYEVIYPATSTSQLQPGDILILNEGTTQGASGKIIVGNGAGGGGHTFIYVGKQSPIGYNEASASLTDRSANLGMAQLTDNRGQYLIARLK